jgi:uncharacterized integral membrane protein
MTYPNPGDTQPGSPSTSPPTPHPAPPTTSWASPPDTPPAAAGDYPRYPAGAGTAAAGGMPTDAQGRPGPAPGSGLDGRGRVRRTRISGVWIGLVAAGVFLILLIIFIAQNLNDAPIHFLGLSGQVSIGLALLLAGVCGLIIAAVPASARIWQLRKALKKNARHDLPPPT